MAFPFKSSQVLQKASSTPEKLDVELVLKFRGDPAIHAVSVVGSIPELGRGDEAAGVRMKPNPAGSVWKARVKINLGQVFTYKYLVRDSSIEETFSETNVFHGIALTEEHLVARLQKVLITDSWLQQQELDFTQPGEHTVAACATAETTAATAAACRKATQGSGAAKELLPPLCGADQGAGSSTGGVTGTQRVESRLLADAEDKLAEVMVENVTLQRRLQKAEARLQSAMEEVERERVAADEMRDLQADVARLEDEACDLKAALVAARAEAVVERRRAEEAAGQAAARAKDDAAEAMEEDLAAAQRQVKQLKASLASLRAAEARKESEQASMRRQMADAAEEAEAAKAAVCSARKSQESAEAEAAAARKDLGELTLKLSEHATKLADAQRVRREALNEVVLLTDNLDKKDSDMAAMEADFDRERSVHREEVAVLDAELATLRKRLSEAQKEAAAAAPSAGQTDQAQDEVVQRLQADLLTAKSALSRTQATLEEARAAEFSAQRELRAAQGEVGKLGERSARLAAENKTLFNTILDLKGNIRVFARVRPMGVTVRDESGSVAPAVGCMSESALVVTTQAKRGPTMKRFTFDRIFSPTSTQEEVYGEVAPLVRSALDGYNVCVFAYGQTGSGKTFTMQGTAAQPGVNVRALQELFALAADRADVADTRIAVSMLEIYNERVRDLLAGASALPPCHFDMSGSGGVAAADEALAPDGIDSGNLDLKQAGDGCVYAKGLAWLPVSCQADIAAVFEAGTAARSVCATQSNDVSSRSHCVLAVEAVVTPRGRGNPTRSRLYMVDLAGSERLKKSGAEGAAKREAASINRSLSALGDVMSALQSQASHVPFRNSKLTHLLKDALGGHNKALMLAQVSPHPDDTTETVCSLTFARRAAQVELGCAQKGVVGGKAPSRKPTQSSRNAGASPSSPDAMQELLAERVEGLQLELSRTEGQVVALRGEVAASATALAEAKAQHNASKTTSEAEITALRERIARLSSLLEGVSTPAAATRGSACPASRRFSCVAVTDRPRRGLEAGVENTPPRTPGVFSTAEVLVATPRTAPRSAAVGFAAASKTAPLPAAVEDLGQSRKTLHFADEAWAKPTPSASQQRAGAASSKPKARRPKTAPRQRLAATLGPSTVANQGRRQGGLAAKRSGSASATRRPRSAARYANVKPRIDTGRSARSIAAGRSRRAAQQADA